MLKVGLTGGIGSGKTLVARVFSELGVPVYTADTKARELMETNRTLMNAISQLLGEEAYSADGKLNRSYVGERVFFDRPLLDKLNALVHPVVHEDFRVWCGYHAEAAYVLEEAAIMFESGGYRLMDRVIFVKAPLEQRIERVVQRDGITREQVEARMAMQMADAEKEQRSDHVINNSNDSMILPQIVALHEAFKKIKG